MQILLYVKLLNRGQFARKILSLALSIVLYDYISLVIVPALMGHRYGERTEMPFVPRIWSGFFNIWLYSVRFLLLSMLIFGTYHRCPGCRETAEDLAPAEFKSGFLVWNAINGKHLFKPKTITTVHWTITLPRLRSRVEFFRDRVLFASK